MTPSQLTRSMNWIAMPVALIVFSLVAYHIYQRHFVQVQSGIMYKFDDLPSLETTTLNADVNAIIQAHIFGVKPQITEPKLETVVKIAPPKAAPKTQLNIKLTGVIDGLTPENGMAMLEVERGRTLVVAVGEKIGDTDAVLHQVLPGEVLIDRDGTIESVKMVRKTLTIESLDPALSSNSPQPYTESENRSAALQNKRSANGSSEPYAATAPSPSYQQQTSILTRKSSTPRKTARNAETGKAGNTLPIPRALRK